ncbi:Uncharacterized protein Adt_29567 [Abeliophyllum distichum]|uniref:Uncharacterized protein n=1 Tax=Abeliophyllum distichum TaxID=126358 RepID=A0ABD1RAF1_9LAMI
MLSLEQQLEDMMGHKIAKTMSKKSSRPQSMVLEEDHFSLEVIVVPLPLDFKQPKMEKYDGSSDHIDHLRNFVDLMRLEATSDAIMCRVFPPTLRQEARDWVATISPKLIRTFDDFSKATLGIKDLQISAVVTAMMCETQSRLFKISLSKNSLDTMYELLKRVDNYVDTKEAYLITKIMKDRKKPESNKNETRDESKHRDDKDKQKTNYLRRINDECTKEGSG